MKKSPTFFCNLPYESYEKKSSYEVEKTFNTVVQNLHLLLNCRHVYRVFTVPVLPKLMCV